MVVSMSIKSYLSISGVVLLASLLGGGNAFAVTVALTPGGGAGAGAGGPLGPAPKPKVKVAAKAVTPGVSVTRGAGGVTLAPTRKPNGKNGKDGKDVKSSVKNAVENKGRTVDIPSTGKKEQAKKPKSDASRLGASTAGWAYAPTADVPNGTKRIDY